MYNTEQVIRGLISYADNEIMFKLPTSGKWIVGTAIGIVMNKTSHIIDSLKSNPVVSMLGIIDNNNNIDIDALMTALRSSADKYGNLTITIPLIGSMTFSTDDIDQIRSYIQ